MRMRIFASVLALATLCLLPVMTNTVRAAESMPDAKAFTEVNISRIKSVLRLTPEQQSYWAPVESALRQIAREQEPSSGGLMRRISRRVVSIALNSAAVARLGAAARPLVSTLDAQQRSAAMAVIHEMGLGPMLAALN